MNEFPLLPYVERFPEKIATWAAYHAALKSGELKRQPCEVCGKTERIHGHHPDYSKPLDVMWLCTRHHIAWHREHGAGLNGGDENLFPEHRNWGRNLTSMRFGKLIVLRELESRHGARIWQCRCDCGNECERPSIVLCSQKLGRCDACAQRAAENQKRMKRTRFAQQLQYLGTMFSDAWVDAMTTELRGAFAQEFGELQPTIADLGPLCSGGLESLMEPVERDEDYDLAMTLQEIGNEYGITRERVRQLEARSLKKLQRAAKQIRTDGVPLRRPLSVEVPALRLVLPSTRPKAEVRAKVRKQRRACKRCGLRGHDIRNCKQEAA